MAEIRCELYTRMIENTPMFRAVVVSDGLFCWRGAWRERCRDAVDDAERIAESLATDNRDVLTLKRTLRARLVVSGYGDTGGASAD